jgi:hypothetical protein
MAVTTDSAIEIVAHRESEWVNMSHKLLIR